MITASPRGEREISCTNIIDVFITASLVCLEQANDVCAARHPPLAASTGLPFLLVELSSLAALGRSPEILPEMSRDLPRGGVRTSRAACPPTAAGSLPRSLPAPSPRSRGVPSAFEALAAGGAATLLPPKVLAYVRLD